MDQDVKNSSGLQSTLIRGLAILEFIASAEKLVRLKDVSEQFSINRSTALRVIQTLEHLGFIQKYEELKAYSAGPRIYELYNPKPTIEKLMAKVKPYLEKLARITGQCAHLGVLERDNAILVGVESSPGRITVKQAVGDLEPLYSSAVGKAIYSFLPAQERNRRGNAITFKKQTKNTITDLSALNSAAESIRNSGVAFDDKEITNDICCIACPVFDKSKRPIASIGISMVAALINGSVKEQHHLIASVRNIAKEIETAELNL